MKLFKQLKAAWFEVLGSDPSEASEGRFYWNNTLKSVRVHNGNDFQSVGTGSSGDENFDGGAPADVYLPSQNIDGGTP